MKSGVIDSTEVDAVSILDSNYQANPLVEKTDVLLIEDDIIVIELLQEVLISAGFKVLISRNAVEGLSLFLANKEKIICVVLDYGIPGMHPSRLLERLCEIDSEAKVILSSGYSQNFILEDFPLDKIQAFLAKPYDPMSLVREVQGIKK
ncbi:MAG: response regulator [Proteobacteria bacterium]|nr:response regulator [Pseudomonadota bacterium]